MAFRSALGALSVVVLVVACRGGNDSPSPTTDASTPAGLGSGIQGAWSIADYKSANGTSSTNPPGLFLFSSTRYSIIYSNQASARPTFADADAPTDPEKLSAFDTFIANSGSYELVGDTLTVHPVISKNPNYMGGGEDRFAVRISGDTLWLTNIAGAFRWAGGKASSNTTTAVDNFKLVRVR